MPKSSSFMRTGTGLRRMAVQDGTPDEPTLPVSSFCGQAAGDWIRYRTLILLLLLDVPFTSNMWNSYPSDTNQRPFDCFSNILRPILGVKHTVGLLRVS